MFEVETERKKIKHPRSAAFVSVCSKGAKIIQSFMWYLNPRQVFDLTKGGPGEG